VNGEPKFPLRWTGAPLGVKGYDLDVMSPYEYELAQFLEKVPLTNIHDLLNREGDVVRMAAYLRECPLQVSYLFCFVILFGLLT
jgi:hypothetical protein